MFVGNRAVISCDVLRGVITSSVPSDSTLGQRAASALCLPVSD